MADYNTLSTINIKNQGKAFGSPGIAANQILDYINVKN